jgi:hypothetical protein
MSNRGLTGQAVHFVRAGVEGQAVLLRREDDGLRFVGPGAGHDGGRHHE